MSEPFIGEIKMFAGNFPPRGYAFCSGQLISIAQNSALFAILGTTYGGDGQTTFALPNLHKQSPHLYSVLIRRKCPLSALKISGCIII